MRKVRNSFNRELELLNMELTNMGKAIETAIDYAEKALFQRDEKLVKSALEYDTEVDHLEQTIETRCLQLLLRQQPVARDLRTISAALKMITDMERIGDQAGDIAEVSLRLPEDLDMDRLKNIQAMSKASAKMVTNAVDAFVTRNQTLAEHIMAADDEVDHLFEVVRDELIETVRQESGDVAAAIDLLMIAKYFERIGDHAVNIAEWVIYSITGQHKSEEILVEEGKKN